MTQAQDFVKWAKDHTKYTDYPDEVIDEYCNETSSTAVEVSSEEIGVERRWDREVQTASRFDDGSLVVSTYWSALQGDHADGVYPDPSFYVGRAVEMTVTRYLRVGS
jgi:hypothetical protein